MRADGRTGGPAGERSPPAMLVGLLLGGGLVLAACSHAPPQAPAPDQFPSPPAVAESLTPAAAAGTYGLRASIQSARGRVPRRSRSGLLQLSGTPSAAPLAGDGAPGTQFNAAVALEGYTQAPRGRRTQAGAWWPIGGDSVAVQFTVPSGSAIQLRGALQGRRIEGEVWFVSGATGSSFQMGTFVATKR